MDAHAFVETTGHCRIVLCALSDTILRMIVGAASRRTTVTLNVSGSVPLLWIATATQSLLLGWLDLVYVIVEMVGRALPADYALRPFKERIATSVRRVTSATRTV